MKMELDEAIEKLKKNGAVLLESVKDDLDEYESRFTVGRGFASDKVIQRSIASSGALDGGETFYPKHIVLKLIEEYEAKIADLKDEVKMLEQEVNDLDLNR